MNAKKRKEMFDRLKEIFDEINRLNHEAEDILRTLEYHEVKVYV